MKALPVGLAELRREGSDIALLAFGSMVETAEVVAEELDASVVNMRFIKPLDEDMIVRMAARHRVLVTLEDNAVAGGAGSGINECLAMRGIETPILNLGIPDEFIEHGSREQCLADAGLDGASVLTAIRHWIGQPATRQIALK
jgi:1-deoxy-D-xylulose-5-phosphate synthase